MTVYDRLLAGPHGGELHFLELALGFFSAGGSGVLANDVHDALRSSAHIDGADISIDAQIASGGKRAGCLFDPATTVLINANVLRQQGQRKRQRQADGPSPARLPDQDPVASVPFACYRP